MIRYGTLTNNLLERLSIDETLRNTLHENINPLTREIKAVCVYDDLDMKLISAGGIRLNESLQWVAWLEPGEMVSKPLALCRKVKRFLDVNQIVERTVIHAVCKEEAHERFLMFLGFIRDGRYTSESGGESFSLWVRPYRGAIC